jgi:exodeoxyribonuclease VII large subunit
MDEFVTDSTSHVYSPSELNREIKLHLEAGFPRLLVEGEISNLSRPASGHLYFSLKDESAQLRCAMFRPAVTRSGLQLQNGMKVVARGRISLYEARGDFQLIVEAVRDAGEGALQRAFEALKQKLQDEGLFDPQRRRPLPAYPLRIGVITSPSGAAIRDITQVLQRRWPVAEIRVYAAAVQGTEAPAELRAALARANREAWAELLILGRGGGSLEDLQAFNDEALARAVAASGLPVISAVGHETDFSICDFVADLRAPTPSAAAELATPDGAQVRAALARFERMLVQRMLSGLQQRMQHFDHLAHRLAQRDPALRVREQAARLNALSAALIRLAARRIRDLAGRAQQAEQRLRRQHPQRRLDESRARVDALAGAVRRHTDRELQRGQRRLRDLARTLHAVSPLATLERGYAALWEADSGRVLTSARAVVAGARLDAQLADGRLRCSVLSVSGAVLDGNPVAADEAEG